ncbi:MAG: hypothetical protein LC672_01400, partial [Acidobacteria bacterium]|nr:hypothetical protein [Acidobacteriota bacterium]
MKPQNLLPVVRISKPAALMLALLASTIALSAVGIVSSTAQSAQQDEREFKNTVPAHVPVKVKLKNEQSFKDKKNKKWARELEIEVKNTGSKPIYFMYLVIVMRDMIVAGHPAGFQLTYGRKELVRLDAPKLPDDIPLMPGETTVLRISEVQVSGYEKLRDEEGRPEPKKIEFDLQLINFGDGTGLRSRMGHPHPDPAKKKSSSIRRDGPNSSPSLPRDSLLGGLSRSFYSALPASFLRVNFSLPATALTTCPPSPSLDLCG